VRDDFIIRDFVGNILIAKSMALVSALGRDNWSLARLEVRGDGGGAKRIWIEGGVLVG